MLSLSDMQGLWSRSLLVRADETRDTTTWVAWLQGPTLFADLRQPEGRPSFDGVGSLDDLSREQVAWLAEQEGFAGRLEQDGEFFVWRRLLDFQPKALTPDSGRLYLDGPIMVEEGRHSPYIEHWHREVDGPSPCAAVWLRDLATKQDAFLVRAGAAFMYARSGASAALPAGATLPECVSATHSLAAARELVDCEISFGRIDGAGWTIARSSLPFREGKQLDPHMDGSTCWTTSDTAGDGGAVRRSWEIVEIEGDETALGCGTGCDGAVRAHG